MPWHTPNDLVGTQTVARAVCVPDTLIHFITGALAELLIPHNWEQVGTETVDDTVQAMHVIFDDYINGGCSMVGVVVPYMRNVVPPNVLPLDGSTYAGSQYPQLYGVIHDDLKTVPGGFVLPNVNGLGVMAASTGAEGTTEVGETTPSALISLTTNELPFHNHQRMLPDSGVKVAEDPLGPTAVKAAPQSLQGGEPKGNGAPFRIPQAIVAFEWGIIFR